MILEKDELDQVVIKKIYIYFRLFTFTSEKPLVRQLGQMRCIPEYKFPRYTRISCTEKFSEMGVHRMCVGNVEV